MALKSYKPTSPARRGLILVDKSGLWKGKPVKKLVEGKNKTGGRNIRVMLHRAASPVVISKNIVSSISSGANGIWPLRLSGSNMIQTAPPLSR